MIELFKNGINYCIEHVSIEFSCFSLFNDSTVLQLSMLYVLYMIIISHNSYYILFYTFIELVFFGLALSLFQIEVFTAFLWLTELVVLLVFLFVLLNVAPSSSYNNSSEDNNRFFFLLKIITVIVAGYSYSCMLSTEFSINSFLIAYVHFDDYYEAWNNTNINDLYGIFLSFYILNSIEIIIVGFILLFGSMVAVKLNSFINSNKTIGYSSNFKIFDIFKTIKDSLFLRKQNLVNQENTKESTRVFKKKNKK